MGRDLLAWPGAPLAIVSAALFGASTPFAKLLLGDGISPWLLAGLLYLGSGIGLSIIHLGRRAVGLAAAEAPLRRADMPWLALVVLSGGAIGPVLLLIGLTTTPASSTALLLNLESLATMVIAGAVLLSWQGGPGGFGLGAIAIAGACVAWGLDNNLTRKLSAADPVQVALIKGLVAGAVNLALALTAGAFLPTISALGGAMLVGFLGYGVSLVLFVLGLRHLGAARTGAYFSTAPFIGAILAVAMFDEPITARLIGAGFLMAIGLYLHLSEAHEHEHQHEAIDHEHRHIHDAHHRHSHAPNDPLGEPHSHWHRHVPMIHKHPHYPDTHHRHEHAHSH